MAAANAVLEAQCSPDLLKKLGDEGEDKPEPTKLSTQQRQKQLYNRRAGVVELHPGDKVLVKLEAFRGQWRKLKNRWGDALYTVVKRVADGIPAYEVEQEKTSAPPGTTASLARRTGRRAAQDKPHIDRIWSHRSRTGDATP